MHVAITGASAGIGEALAREWSRAGAMVTLVARRRDRLEALARELGDGAFVIEADLADPAPAAGWIAAAEERNGPIDVLVNNAGVYRVEASAEMDVEAGERLLRLNLFTPLRLARAVLPRMVARGSGAIVNIASAAALAPTPGITYYNASKGGLAAASEALRGELRATGVNVVTVYPGPIRTEMLEGGLRAFEENRAVRAMPVGAPEALAREVRRAVEKRRARVVYPRSMASARWFPNLTRYLMDRFTPKVKAAPAG
jgi:short-subunit dehydrogenase